MPRLLEEEGEDSLWERIAVRALIFKKAKLQEATRGQIGCTGAVGKQGLASMHLCTCNLWGLTSEEGEGRETSGSKRLVSEEEDFCGGPSCCALYSIRREIVTNDIVRPT